MQEVVSDLNIFVWKWSKIAAQFFLYFFCLILPYKTCWKPRFLMGEKPLVEGHIANFGISLDVFGFLRFGWFFPFKKKKGFCVFLVHPTVVSVPVSSVPPVYKSFRSEVGFPVLSSDRGVIRGQINRARFTSWISVFRFTVVLATCVTGMHCS